VSGRVVYVVFFFFFFAAAAASFASFAFAMRLIARWFRSLAL
jgi:hypothetical protein